VDTVIVLDDLDRRLVHALQLDARAALTDVAGVLGVSGRTLARRYRRLRECGAVRVVGLPDTARLGHTDWFVRIRCVPDAVEPVAAALARRPDTSWVALVCGGTEITCITRSTATTGAALLRTLPRTSRITAVTAQCLLRPVAGVGGWFGRVDALDPAQIAALQPVPPRPSGPVMLDELDRRLIAELAVDGRTPLPVLAAATGAAETTLRRRLQVLRDNRLLYFDVEVDPGLFGFGMQAVLWLSVAPAHLPDAARALADHPEVAFAAATTGSADLMAFLVCRDPDAFYEYLTGRLGSLSGIQHVETAPIDGYTKRAGTPLPI
jgi:DNA-binding Lrp family transcriptional regulator